MRKYQSIGAIHVWAAGRVVRVAALFAEPLDLSDRVFGDDASGSHGDGFVQLRRGGETIVVN
jgi:hypothetical protein